MEPSSNSENFYLKGELDTIFMKMKTEKSLMSIKLLCSHIKKNRPYTDEIIRKICRFFNGENSIPDNIILKTITSVLQLLIENSQIINFLNMMLPLLVPLIYHSNRSVPELDNIIRVIGSLIKDRGLFIRQIIESNISSLFDKFSKDSTSYKYENTKYAMIRLLTEIIDKLPTIAYNKIIDKSTFEIFLRILDNFKEPREEIRKAVGELLNKFFIMIDNREINTKDLYTNQIYERIRIKFEKHINENNPPTSYSTVNGFIILIMNFQLRKDFIKLKYEAILSMLLTCRESKNHLIKATFIESLPFMAQYDMDHFSKDYAHLVIPWMTSQLGTKTHSDLRKAILQTFGKFTKMLPSFKIEEKLGLVVDSIKSFFDKDIIEPSILDGLASIMENYPDIVKKTINFNTVLNKIFKIGFYQCHINLIEQILLNFDQYKIEHIKILIIVLNVISVIITEDKEKFYFNYCMKYLNKSQFFDFEKDKDLYINPKQAIEGYLKENSLSLPELRINAMSYLKQIKHLYFIKDILNFYYNSCLKYLTQKTNVNVKLKCIDLSSAIWLRIYQDDIAESQFLISSILDSYLNFVINDDYEEARYKILRNINCTFFSLLSNQPFFQKLVSILSLNDPEIKRLTLFIIGQVAKYNPNNYYVILFIQKNIIDILMEIALCNRVFQKEEKVIYLYNFVINTKNFFSQEDVDMIYETLSSLIQQEVNNPILNVNILKIIGEIVDRDDNREDERNEPYLKIIIDICINNIREGINTSKLEVSLETIYYIIKRKRIDLYQQSKLIITSSNALSKVVSGPYLEIVMILLNILARDTSEISKKYVLNIFGLCGAMDPERLEKLYSGIPLTTQKLSSFIPNQKQNETTLITSNEIDPCTRQAVISLMRILKDNSQQELSTQIIAYLGGLIKSLEPTDSPLIDIILPTMLEMIPQFEQTYVKSMFENMTIILIHFKERFFNHIDQFINIVKVYLIKENYHDIIFQILPIALSEFDLEKYYSILIPIFIRLISLKSKGTLNIIICFSLMAYKLGPYLNIVIPKILGLYLKNDSFEICDAVIEFIEKIIYLEKITFYLPSIIQVTLKKVKITKQYQDKTIGILELINSLFRNSFLSYLPMIISTFKAYGTPQHLQKIKELFKESGSVKELKKQICVFKCIMGTNYKRSNDPEIDNSNINNTFIREIIKRKNRKYSLADSGNNLLNNPSFRNRKTQTNKELIVKEFDTSYCTVEEDWREWFKATSKILFEQSPSYALFYCHMVADYYFPLIIELYNYGFISVWRNLNDIHKMTVINHLNRALTDPRTPNDILLTILNLAEFVERKENQNEFIDFAKLGNVALKCKAYAKALFYKECDFRNKNDLVTFEELIALYHELKLPESAYGILKSAQKGQKNNEKFNDENWFIKLHKWKEGIREIDKGLKKDPNNKSLLRNKVLCLDGLGDWEGLLEMNLPIDEESSLILCKASLNLSDWDNLNKYKNNLCAKDNKDISYAKGFFDAIIAIKEEQYQNAENYINLARKEIEIKIKSLLSESYARGYELLIKNEMLYQLNEIIEYKKKKTSKEQIIERWNKRFKYINKDPSILEKILAIRSIVFTMNEDYEKYLSLANIYRKANQFDSCQKVLERIKKRLQSSDNLEEINIRVDLQINKCLFENNKIEDAIENTKRIINEHNLDTINDKLKSKVYGLYAFFTSSEVDLKKENVNQTVKNILQYLELSTKFNEKNYKSWHSYGLLNYKYFLHLSEIEISNKGKIEYAINAINGFTHSITIGGKNISKILQDLLRLLELWFKIGSVEGVPSLFEKAFSVIDTDSFLLVIPQLLARIDIRDNIIYKALHNLLLKIGNLHPRAVIYHLIVMNNLKNLRSRRRREAASSILNEMNKEHDLLKKECQMFVGELNRCGMLLHEEWYDAIEEGAKLYFNSNDTKGMINILIPVHEKMNRPPETMNEVHFHQLYSSELAEAEANIRAYIDTSDEMELKQAWEIYHSVYKSIGEQFNEFKAIDLENVSPKLFNFKQSQICVPGIYSNSDNLIRISHIARTLTIFSTKQHPRKITIYGTNNKEYMFLLKGHEDLRQDERAMQLFNLVNTLLSNDRKTTHKNLFIKTFTVIPLSHNTGIIGWVPNCDTLHQLIKEYRTNNKIIQNAEHRFMYSMCPKFESSTFLVKVEIFKRALQNTLGLEIYKILWKKSKNSEAWLERRTNYSRSLAVMSMVGYILGLGDRHPLNLMLDRNSGKIIHIDFGDCFEVAMKRDKFPERVPFRLTRMLIKALEVSGIEGTFRITCEIVMQILRENKDSLLEILASFVHDPLISFRLMIPMIMKKNRFSRKDSVNSSDKIIKKENSENTINENTITENTITENTNEEGRIGENGNNQIEQGEIMDDTDERKKLHNDERQIFTLFEERDEVESEELNKIAKIVIERIKDKLQGTDFRKDMVLDVKSQVDRLIIQATSHENLAQSYLGWCPFW